MIETGLRGKAVLVTGAAAGIGRATARRFAAEGARVCGWDVRPEPAEELVADWREAGAEEARFAAVDVTDAAAVEAGVDALVEAWGTVDVLINNAGIVRDAQLVKWRDGDVVARMEEEVFDRVVDVNLKGVFLCTRAVVPAMARAGGGVVLNASSVVGLYGNFGQTNYAATKGGVITMSKGWARELGKRGIRVNVVAPGFVATEILRAMPDKVLAGFAERTPLGRMGEPEEIANVYLWLASDGASFVHGAVISVDGGLVIGT